MEKKNLRRVVRERLAKLSSEDKAIKSAKLLMALASHAVLREARVVAFFSPLPDEPQLKEFAKFLSTKCLVVLPRVEGDVMEFYPYSEENMRLGSYGIMEPVGEVPLAPGSIDAMFVPGVAFTSAGERLGRGKGYYDEYMSRDGFRAHTLGICFEEQLVPFVPCEPHDVRVDEVVAR